MFNPFLLGGEEVLSLLPNFQKEGGLDRISIFRSHDLRGWLLGIRVVAFFQRGLQFLHNKKFFLLVITENLNCEILTKNSVTFKRWDGTKDEKF